MDHSSSSSSSSSNSGATRKRKKKEKKKKKKTGDRQTDYIHQSGKRLGDATDAGDAAGNVPFRRRVSGSDLN